MRNYYDCGAAGVYLVKKRHYLLACLAVKRACRFVCKNDFRSCNKRTRNCNALLLATRQFMRTKIHLAYKRNLLKRRLRESYRLQKDLLGPGVDILFVYLSREVLTSGEIFADMTAVLKEVRGNE